MKLGIDFGTTRTVVAAVDGGRYPVVSFDAGGAYPAVRDWFPGLVAKSDAPEELRFGWDARAAVGRPSARMLRSLKRVVSELRPDDVVPGFERTALELTTAYLAELRRALFKRSNLPLAADETLEVMVAVPAGASGRQRYLTLEAFERAGFHVIGMLNEPTAAAIEFGERHVRDLGPRSPKRYVVVYDLGGGTFDASAVSLQGRRFELLATEGESRIGGDDFDAIILEMALESLGYEGGQLDAPLRAVLLEACREAKEGVGPNHRRLLVDLGALEIESEPVVLPTSGIYARCQPLIERTLAHTERLLARLPERGIDPRNARELAALYVVGGSAAFPPVTRGLRAAHGRKLALGLQPHAATAVGLAVAADPEAGIFVREAATRYFGVWREAESGQEKVFDRIVSKEALPEAREPLVTQRCYRPAHRVGHLRFLECTELTERGEPAGDVTPLDEVLFPYDPSLAGRDLRGAPRERAPEPAGDEIVETYTLGASGRISVEIENRTHGYRESYALGER